MKRIRTILALTVALPAIAACGGQADSDNVVVAETNQQTSGQNAMMNDPSNPYAEAEMQMHERMMAATGSDASETWIRKMIEHHRGAIAMSNIVLGQSQDARVRAMASETVEKQTRDIEALERMLQAGDGATTAAPPQTSGAVPPATTGAATTPRPKAESTAPPRAATPPRPKAPAPTPDPMAGHDMANMSNMSHD